MTATHHVRSLVLIMIVAIFAHAGLANAQDRTGEVIAKLKAVHIVLTVAAGDIDGAVPKLRQIEQFLKETDAIPKTDVNRPKIRFRLALATDDLDRVSRVVADVDRTVQSISAGLDFLEMFIASASLREGFDLVRTLLASVAADTASVQRRIDSTRQAIASISAGLN